MKKLIAILTFMLFVQCDTLHQSIQHANIGLGGHCLRITCEVGPYNSEKKEYDMGYSFREDKEGNDVSYNENIWLRNKEIETTNSGIGVYYCESPYSEGNYKFIVNCVEWQRQ